jgi:GTP-binding protein
VFDSGLEANDDQFDFLTMFASGRSGWCGRDIVKAHAKKPDALTRSFRTYLTPVHRSQKSLFRMLATTLSADPFIGRILTGRVEAGTLKSRRNCKPCQCGWR